MQYANSLRQVLVAQIASGSDLELAAKSGIGFIPCKYNGWKGAMTRESVASMGMNYMFHGVKKVSYQPDVFQNGPDYGMRFVFRDGVIKCLVPDLPENVAKLAELCKPQKKMVYKRTESGHKLEQDGFNPPMFERLDSPDNSLDLAGMSTEEATSLAAELFKTLQARGALPDLQPAPAAHGSAIASAAPVSSEPAKPVGEAPTPEVPAPQAQPTAQSQSQGDRGDRSGRPRN